MINTDFRAKMWTDTSANFIAADPTPAAGEILFTIDTNEIRVGDGSTSYASLVAIGGGVGAHIPKGYIYGLETSNDTDTEHDILISSGGCKDSAGAENIVLSTAITKQIDATWAAGDDAGGLFTGTVAADTTYHVFLIKKDSDGTIDAGFDTSITASNIPTGYTAYRRIWSVLTDSSSNVIQYIQRGDDCQYLLRINDIPTYANLPVAATTHTVSVPSNVLFAKLSLNATDSAHFSIAFFNMDETTFTPVLPNNTGIIGELSGRGNATADTISTSIYKVQNVTARQFKTTAAAIITNFNLSTLGYIDTRGKNGEG